MDLLSNLAMGFASALSLQNLFYCFVGVSLGTFIGVLPGVGGLAAISLLLPITFYIEPTSAVVMLAGVYYGSQYGGSITSILLNLPGETSSAVTCLDGHPMARQGRAGVALMMTAAGSFIGGVIGIVVLIAFAPVLSAVALSFGPAEYFAVMVLGVLAAATVAQGTPLKGVAMVVLGLLLGTIGTDLNTGTPRFTLGFFELYDGIDLIAMAMGLFGVTEIIASVLSNEKGQVIQKVRFREMFPTRDDVRRSVWPIVRGSGVGTVFGTLPGTGVTLASFLSYALEKKVSRQPERFGSGAIEGVAGPETANNAAAQTSFIPTLTLGIPGSATMALIIGALMLHGITPGPRLMADHPELFWSLIASFFIGNVMLVILNVPLIGLWVKFLQIPYKLMYPMIIVLLCIGSDSVNLNAFDVVVTFVIGVVGFVLRVCGFQPAPLLIAFVLGPMMEEHFRRAMLLEGGDWTALFQRPVSGTLLVLSIGLVLWACWTAYANRMRGRAKIAFEQEV